MADATSTFDRPPPPPAGDWGQAFAALPQASPPADAWPALAARARQAREARRRRVWRSGFALAATLACAAFGLALWSMQGGMREAIDAGSTQAAVTDDGAQLPMPTQATASAAPVADADAAASAASAATDREAATATDAPVAIAAGAGRTSFPGPRRGERPRRAVPPRPPTAETLTLPVERRLAGGATGGDMSSSSAAVADPQTSPVASVAATDGATDDQALQRLQARSAQLEAWLSVLRDPSVGTGPGALIAAELDDRLAGIDAALAVVPNDGVDVQRELWQARVAALQRALVFESELRALAAEGRDYDGALVSVD